MENRMKIAILHGPRDLTIEEQPLDTANLKPNEIWLETEITALKIGTDRGNYEGAEQVPGAPDYPRWVGDSNLAVVRGIGSAVTRVQVGDRVVTRQPHQSEYVTAESESIVKVPDSVHPEDAVYTHLYALSAHCYRKAHFQPGENVAVVGLGVLGLGAVGLGPAFGARVVGLGNSPVRLESPTASTRKTPSTPISTP
jgi:threonine dehydrogenase-like Zn-dependent dehydrogenase